MKILMYCLLALNVGVWLMYGIDKWKAKSGRWRIPEKVLLLAAFAGGSVGALARLVLLQAVGVCLLTKSLEILTNIQQMEIGETFLPTFMEPVL